LSLGAEYTYWHGWVRAENKWQALAEIETAARVFPLDWRLRIGPAVYHGVRRPGPLAEDIAAIRAGLAFDPLRLDLRGQLAELLLEAGDPDAAMTEIEIIAAVSPLSRFRVVNGALRR